MKRPYLILFLLLLILTAKAQNPMTAAEAKAAYMLAEEQYAAGNYSGALSYLKTATEKLGKANSKILYLQIMAQQELSKTDKSYSSRVDSSIALFENAPDLAQFNEEKTFEIVKLKLQRKEQLKADERLKKYDLLDLPLGITFEEAKSQKPEFFTNTGTYNASTKTGYVQSGYTWLHFKNGRLFSVAKSIYFSRDGAMEKTRNESLATLQQNKSQTNMSPAEKVDNRTGECNSTTNLYTWQSGTRTIQLMMITVTGVPCGAGTITGSISVSDAGV